MRQLSLRVALLCALIVSLLAALCACNTTVVTVAAYRVPVSPWDGPWMAYRMAMPDGQTIHWIWGIHGFDEQYQWGTRYVLELRELRISNAPTDAPSTRYELLRVVEAEPMEANSTIQLPLRSYRDVYVRYHEERGEHTLLDEVQIAFDGPATATRLWVALSMYPEAVGTFSFHADGRLHLMDIGGEFDLEIAMRSYAELFGEPDDGAPFSWGEQAFAERFTAYYAERFPGGG